MKKVALVGGAGRMGQSLGEHLNLLDAVAVTTLVDVNEPREHFGARYVTSLDEADPTEVDVVVDFSHPDSVVTSARWCAVQARGLVVGTTGLSDDQRRAVEDAARSTGVIMASNFSLGAVLSERFAAMAAPYFERVEIIELHHEKKLDSPSGTALLTAQKIAQARKEAGTSPIPTPPNTLEKAPGARGARHENTGDIPVHSVRLPGFVAHQEVIFGGTGEILTIRHDSVHRNSFMPGVVLAVRKVGGLQGLVVGLENLL